MRVPLTPARCLYRAVDLYARKEGVVSGEKRFTYGQFGERCERLAAGLQRLGVQRGDRVAFLSFNTHELLEGYYGPLLIRAISMPLNVRLSPAELIEILKHAEPRVLIVEAEFATLVAEFRKACPGIEKYVNIGEDRAGADLTYEELLAQERLARPDLFSFDEDEIAELFYTSGSTGTPKGVMLSHRTLYLHALNVCGSMTQNDRSVELHTIPLFHANGWGRPQTATMNGAKQVMVRRFEPVTVLRLIEQEGATGMLLVPVMANALALAAEGSTFHTSTLQEIYIGGAASSPELIAQLERVFRCRVFAGYGLTETAPVATSARDKDGVIYRDEADRLFHLSMAGWPILGAEVHVLDEAGSAVARDRRAIGEIVIRGDGVMDGYYRDPEATRAAIADGWLRTGDMAVWDEENYVHIVDRKKDMIVSGGENISSIEIEKAIAAHPAVLECAVFAVPDAKWGEVPAAVVALKPGHELGREELLVFLQGRVAKFKLPRRIEFRNAPLPKTGTGKIMKRELREPFWAGKERRVQGV
jgi:fatty-acyl-CoA synthase